MDAEELALLTATLDELARAHDGAELTKALDDFGFPDVLAASPREAVASLFTAMGQAGTTSAALQDVLLAPLSSANLAAGNPALVSPTAALTATSPTTTANAPLLNGDDEAAPSVVLPLIGAATAGRMGAGGVTLHGLVLGQRTNAGPFLVPVDSGDGIVWVRLSVEPGDLATGQLAIRSVSGLDPALTMLEVTATGPADVVLGGLAADQAWRAVVAAGRCALAYQIVGAVTAMLDLAVAHARDRVQFGQPIGAFQAVRHRLADAYVAREGAAAALDICWQADDEELAALLAKSLTGRAARIAATQCQQVLAGIGFTAEHPFHRYLARAVVLDTLLGSATDLPAQIGARLAAAGTLPRLADL
jgi:alkylation response protein AidB-like acyl-CoA dehydrogenase